MKINLLKSIVASYNHYGILTLDTLLLHGGKFIGRIIFVIKLIWRPSQFINQPSFYPECELKTKSQIFADQLLYILRTGEINKNYFLYGFDRIGKSDFRNYVPWLTFTQARYSKNERSSKPVYSPYNYICLLRDKFIFEAYCSQLGLKTPANNALIRLGKIYVTKSKTNLSIDEILSLELDSFCKRNVSYGGGMPNDVLKLEVSSGNIFINNKQLGLEEFKEIVGNDIWIIQDRIKNQNPQYASFHPYSINTIRIVTINTGFSIELFFSFFRMGINGRHADNWSSGGITTGINIEDGTLEKWGLLKPGLGTKSDRHPNSKIVFEGYKLPFWTEAVELAKRAHQLFYGLHSIGWDICMTTEGPILIEGNDNWDTSGSQLYKGAREEFEKYFK